MHFTCQKLYCVFNIFLYSQIYTCMYHRFPELQELSSSELQNLLSNPETLNDFIITLPCFSSFAKMEEEIKSANSDKAG